MASTTAVAKYPRQLVAVVTEATYDTVTAAALNAGRSKAEVVREYLATGQALHAAALDAGTDPATLLDLALLAAARGTLREKATTVELEGGAS